MSINHGNFDSVCDIFNNSAIYCVPTFQRPFAWESKQVDDLINDIHSASRRDLGYHYLSPVHLVHISCPNDLNWERYTDRENEDINLLTNSRFKDTDGMPWTIYFVIDGQQRLIVLYLILYLITNNSARFTANFGNRKLPKVILNPADDHSFFTKMLKSHFGSSSAGTSSKSQDRLKDLFDRLGKSPFDTKDQDFILSQRFQSLMISLDPDHASGTFLTLNDRGKMLTTFEKLKSFFMDCDFNYCKPPCPANTHRVFGDAYKFLDHKECIVDEDQFVQLAAINVWKGDRSVTFEGASALYERFREEVEKSYQVCDKLTKDWLPTFLEIAKQVDHLNGYFDGSNSHVQLASTIGSNRTVGDDYKIILQSLKLSIRSLAVLFKFRQAFHCEWHENCGTVTLDNRGLKEILNKEIDAVNGELTRCHNSAQHLLDKAKTIGNQISSINPQQTRTVSPLQIAEMMELAVFRRGSTKPGTYAQAWDSSFSGNATSDDAAKQWTYYISSWESREFFLSHLLTPHETRDVHFKYILREHESFKCQKNVHSMEELELEHIFPLDKKAIGAVLLIKYGLSDLDYENFVETLGNKILLDGKLNKSLHQAQPDVKARAYKVQSYGTTIVPTNQQTESSIELGKELLLLALNTEQYRFWLRLRRLEIVLFALKRFF